MKRIDSDARDEDGGLLVTTWKVIAGLAIAVAVIFGATVIVESFAPHIPDGAVAAPLPAAQGGSALPRVEHFHAQFNLKPGGVDPQGHVENF
jgi:hypothetical protein